MTDPNRLIESNDLGADLLASARGDGPSRNARARAAAVLGVGVGVAAMTAGGTASAGAGATATATKVGGVSLLTKILAGTAIVAAVGGGTAVAVHETAKPAPVTVPVATATTTTTTASPRSTPVTTASPTPTQVEEPAPSVEANPLPSSPIATSKPVVHPSTTASAPAQESALTRELRSLDAAKAKLDAHDANGALAALDRHDREFGSGAMRTESAMLRVEALLAKGDEDGAKSRAKQLLAADPNGPHAKRLRTILDR